MPIWIKNYLLLLLSFIVSNNSDAQVISDLQINTLTTDDGLSQGSNYFRYEDSRGFMWLTGNDALNRYDGNTVKVYNLSKYFKNCPTLQQGYGFAEDTEGNMYVGSTRGLYIYHRRKEQFTLCKIFNTPDSVAMPFAFREGKVWCFNRNYQLATYEVATQKVMVRSRLLTDSLPSVHIYNLGDNAFYYRFPFMDDQGKVWVVGKTDIAVWDSHSEQISYPFRNYLQKFKPILRTSNYGKGKIICGTKKGILILNTYTEKVISITQINGQQLGLVHQLAFNDSLIVFKNELGIGFINASYNQLQWLDKSIKNINKMFNLSFDKSGQLWMCDDGVGLVILKLHPFLLARLPEEGVPDLYKLGLGSHTFGQLPNGEIMIGNSVLFNKNEHRLRAFPYAPIRKLGNRSYRLCTDQLRKGVWLYDENYMNDTTTRYMYFGEENRFRKLTVKDKSGLLKSTQKDMVELPDGRLLCSFDEGLYWFHPQEQSLKKVPNIQQTHNFKISLLSGNRLAVSSLNADMQLYQVLSGDSLRLLQSLLPKVQAFYVAEDTLRHRYWVATNAGIYLFNESFVQLRYFDANNGLAGTYIYGLLLDDIGNAWCSHQHGLSYIDAQSFRLINFDKKDGIQDWDFHNRAFFKSADGTLYFGGAKGINYFKPPIKPIIGYEPEVYIDEILVGGRPYMPDTSANYITELQLNFTNNDIVLKALIKDLGAGRSRQLLYRLVGTDTTWKILPNGSSINFNQLAPGTYTLELSIYDKYTEKKGVQKTLRIKVAAPFYHKAWFWALVAVLLTASVFRYINSRKLAQQDIKFHEQLALEKQRQKITADLHDDIGANLSSLQINMAITRQLLENNHSNAGAMLKKMEEQTHILADGIGDIVWSMKPGKDQFIQMSSRIKNFVHDILGATTIQYNIAIDADIDTVVSDITMRKNVVLIVKEAINNVVKYSKASTVNIELHLLEKHLSMVVKDNGIGFDPATTVGNGIGNMKKRTAELSGTFSIQSSPEKGTILSVAIPLIP
jgi:signal transduction histidine kinase/ligand-binding sensor domain-containing protein